MIKFTNLLFFCCLTFFSFSQRPGIPKQQNPPKLVNNFSKEFPDFLSSSEEQDLEAKLVNFARETSNQIVVIIVDDLAGYEPWDFATELGQQWTVGQEKEDNGVVILIKPTGGAGERKTHIAVGRGLEGIMPDLTTKQIVDNELIPNFKNGNFYEGIDKAVDVVMALAKGEYNKKDYTNRNKKSPWSTVIMVIFIIIFIIIFVKKGGNGGGGGNGFTYGAAGFMAGSAFGGRSSGGGSSGGFGGFGGGSFGGGGAGGSW